MSLRMLACIIGIFISFMRPASAARFEKAIGLGVTFFSGNQTTAITPGMSPQLSLAANALLSKRLDLVNRFDFGMISEGANFAGQYGSYNGYTGNYELALRLNVSKDMAFPYVEAGVMLAMYAVTLGNAAKNVSETQTALKYGYAVGIGCDIIKAGQRGEGKGMGIGLTFFNMMKSPSMFEFPSAPMTATGIMFEVRYLFGPSS